MLEREYALRARLGPERPQRHPVEDAQRRHHVRPDQPGAGERPSRGQGADEAARVRVDLPQVRQRLRRFPVLRLRALAALAERELAPIDEHPPRDHPVRDDDRGGQPRGLQRLGDELTGGVHVAGQRHAGQTDRDAEGGTVPDVAQPFRPVSAMRREELPEHAVRGVKHTSQEHGARDLQAHQGEPPERVVPGLVLLRSQRRQHEGARQGGGGEPPQIPPEHRDGSRGPPEVGGHQPVRPTGLPEELEREEGDRHRREARADRLRELRIVGSRAQAVREQPREGRRGEGDSHGEQQALDRGRVPRRGARGRPLAARRQRGPEAPPHDRSREQEREQRGVPPGTPRGIVRQRGRQGRPPGRMQQPGSRVPRRRQIRPGDEFGVSRPEDAFVDEAEKRLARPLELAVGGPHLDEDIEVPGLIVKEQSEVGALGLQHASHRRHHFLAGLPVESLAQLVAGRLVVRREEGRRPPLDIAQGQTPLVEIEHLLLYELRPLLDHPAFIPVAVDVFRQAGAMPLQQETHGTGRAEGRHPLPCSREPFVEVR